MIFAGVMIIATLALALSAGYLSVMGFAMTFQETFWQALALAASLEAGKLVAASFLYRYWSTIKWSMKVGMVAAVIGLMAFTSAGIYGYLSASYQTSSVGLNVNSQRVEMLDEERERSIARKTEIDAQITNLPIDYVSARQKLQQSFGPELERLNNRITEIDAEMLTLKQQTIQDEAHIGPVIFVAGTLGIGADVAISWFILLVVLVFDPLAVMMTLGTNHVLLENTRLRREAKLVKQTPTPEPEPTNPQAPAKDLESTAVEPEPAPEQERGEELAEPTSDDSNRLGQIEETVASIAEMLRREEAQRAERDRRLATKLSVADPSAAT